MPQPNQPSIAPPFGYKEVVPLLKTHRLVLPAAGETPEFMRRGNAVPISHAEFQVAAREYPIVFTTGDAGKTFAAVAVLGIAAGENLFFADGAWALGVYVPAYSRRYPFCMARVTVSNTEQQNRLICVEKSHLDESAGEALFDANGAPSDKWKEIERLLTEYEADLERSREMCGILADYRLLEPFTMQAKLNKGGGPLAMTGMYRVAEQRMADLAGDKLKELAQNGILSRVYAHLISLSNFGRLLERHAAQARLAPGPTRDRKKLN